MLFLSDTFSSASQGCEQPSGVQMVCLSSGQEKWGGYTGDQVWVEENGVASVQVCKVGIRDRVWCSWPRRLWTMSAHSCLGDVPPLETPTAYTVSTALIVIPIPAISTAVTWINNKLMSQSLSWGYCMEQGMRNGAGGFPAFSPLPPNSPRSVITLNQAWGRKYIGRDDGPAIPWWQAGINHGLNWGWVNRGTWPLSPFPEPVWGWLSTDNCYEMNIRFSRRSVSFHREEWISHEMTFLPFPQHQEPHLN